MGNMCSNGVSFRQITGRFFANERKPPRETGGKGTLAFLRQICYNDKTNARGASAGTGKENPHEAHPQKAARFQL